MEDFIYMSFKTNNDIIDIFIKNNFIDRFYL